MTRILRPSRDLGSIRERLDQIERHPALRIAPADYPEAIARAGGTVMREAASQLDRLTRRGERTNGRLRISPQSSARRA
jgi:hypothetical protein